MTQQGEGPAGGFQSAAERPRVPAEIDTTKAHPARVYDYWLGGKDNFAADRALAERFEQLRPTIRLGARENRAFLRRVVTFLAAEAGVRQFLDIGTGIPTANNTHQAAQAVAPTSRVVYTDNDPIVLTHARALLTGDTQGATSYIDGDVRSPDAILAQAREVLDFSQPVAILLLMVLQYVPDDTEAQDAVARLAAALPAGGYLAITAPTQDFVPRETREAVESSYNANSDSGFRYRDRSQFAAYFAGLEIVEPGIVPMAEWRADDEPAPRPKPEDAAGWSALGRRASTRK